MKLTSIARIIPKTKPITDPTKVFGPTLLILLSRKMMSAPSTAPAANPYIRLGAWKGCMKYPATASKATKTSLLKNRLRLLSPPFLDR